MKITIWITIWIRAQRDNPAAIALRLDTKYETYDIASRRVNAAKPILPTTTQQELPLCE